MQGECSICNSWRSELGHCLRCSQLIGLCCWSFDHGCCLTCSFVVKEAAEDARRLSRELLVKAAIPYYGRR